MIFSAPLNENNYWKGKQGNMELTIPELRKIAALNIPLCMDYIFEKKILILNKKACNPFKIYFLSDSFQCQIC